MKSFIMFVVLMCLLVASQASALDICFAWDANTEPDLAGYELYARLEAAAFDYDSPGWEGTGTTGTLTVDESQGRWYFVARAYNIYGEYSGDSNELRWPRGTGPDAPGLRFCLNPIP